MNQGLPPQVDMGQRQFQGPSNDKSELFPMEIEQSKGAQQLSQSLYSEWYLEFLQEISNLDATVILEALRANAMLAHNISFSSVLRYLEGSTDVLPLSKSDQTGEGCSSALIPELTHTMSSTDQLKG